MKAKLVNESLNEFLGVVNESEDYCPQCGAIVTDLDFCDECGYDPYEDDEDDEDDEDLDESKVPTTKKGKEKKFKKVMGEFGKGELKSYHGKSPLKSKKQGGSEKERKQALAIAFSEAGMSKR